MRFVLIAILLLPCALALTPSEVLPNPLGDDNGKEFVELIGSENLAGCTIRDSASSDTLHLVKPGNEVILIVEVDGIYNDTPDATIYHAGLAIGNALGNTADALSVTCEGIVLLNTTYTTSDVDGYAEGYSLLWEGGGWILGAMNGTAGTIARAQEPENVTVNDSRPGQSENRSQKSGHDACNATLDVHVSATRGVAGDPISFAIISDRFASFEVRADNETIITGDTLNTHAYTITLPDAHTLNIKATATQCDARQRATRVVHIEPRAEDDISPTDVESVERNESANLMIAPPMAPTNEEPNAVESIVHAPIEDSQHITGSVVYDPEPNLIPWISAFGICVLCVSAWLWRHTREEREVI